jgi:hypothetical protein
MSNQQSITHLIQQQTQTNLPELAQKMKQLQRLNTVWQKYIDMKLARHSRVANWRNSCLIIEIDSASWATHIRYLLPELLIKLKPEPELAGLRYIEWYIQPIEALTSKTNRHKVLLLSAENSQLISEAAKHITHEKLKRALQALAKNCD